MQNHDSTRYAHHGMSDSPEYKAWDSIIQRCCNPKSREYIRYGARGITVCDRWRESFLAFFSDMGYRPVGKSSIDRINVNLGYVPENCRWATSIEQARNRRDNVWLTYNGETMILVDWATRLGMDSRTLGKRLRLGWSIADAIEMPIRSTSDKRGRNRERHSE